MNDFSLQISYVQTAGTYPQAISPSEMLHTLTLSQGQGLCDFPVKYGDLTSYPSGWTASEWNCVRWLII